MPKPLLSFLKFNETSKTGRWGVYPGRESGVILGVIKWYSPWRRYCFFPLDQTTFDRNCLTEIVNFIDKQMAERKG